MVTITQKLKGSILDIGGGGEGIIGRVYGHQVTAIDNCQEELDEAPGGYQKILMDACNLTFPADSFDHVTFFYSLMFMNADAQSKAISEAVRVLKPGGDLHIWDAEISSAYPEPFTVDLDIQLPTEKVHTTYGIISDIKNQTAATIKEICMDLGLQSERTQTEDGQFYLVFRKPQMQAEFIPIAESEVSALGILRQQAWASTYRGIYPDEMIDQFDYDWHREKDLLRLRNPEYRNWFISVDGERIGYLILRHGGSMLLQSLYLLPRAQKEGVGRQAFQFIRQYCLDNSISVFRCHCHPVNNSAVGFYEKMGGVIVDRDEDNEERWQDSVIFEFSVLTKNMPYNRHINSL